MYAFVIMQPIKCIKYIMIKNITYFVYKNKKKTILTHMLCGLK